jgi:hypothetical protein
MTTDQCERLCDTLRYVFVSPNVCDSNFEAANLVDVVANVGNGLHRIAAAIETLAKTVERWDPDSAPDAEPQPHNVGDGH